MPEKRRLLDLIDRAWRAKAWHGPALLEVLEGVTPAMAAKRVVKGAHTIWELVDHVAMWNEVVRLRLEGINPSLPPEWNFPATPRPTAAAWRAARRRLAASQARFRAAVAAFPEAKLGRRRPRLDTTWYLLIHGQVQHQLYHAGQIALLKRGMGRKP